MKTSMEWFNEKAEFNKWLKELTENERELLLFLIVDAQSEAYNEGVRDAVKACAENIESTKEIERGKVIDMCLSAFYHEINGLPHQTIIFGNWEVENLNRINKIFIDRESILSVEQQLIKK